MAKDAAAVIVAGGKGLRFGGTVRKQYLSLRGRSIIWWSLQAFQKSPSFGSIVLVVPKDDVPEVRRLCRRWSFSKLLSIVPGGKTRTDSVRQGLAEVPDRFRWVAVHDAVRPLIRTKEIEAVLKAAKKYKAAIAAWPSRDTVKLADAKGFIRATPPREQAWLAQTPQIFERRLLEKAYGAGKNLSATDDSQLVERLGVRVKLVQASAENLKITFPPDLILARSIMNERSI
jgi:2-C-methyl-D-erythritol 4-phosphate cytidylyltransferase